ncbi:hypothetical protein [Streptomyces carpaticus]|uniref:Uncharacterized protein n=1 Tax=Streptomyces carpaticus TaxID=285558 RepID=A0ABV4ZU64_9ACTN
MEEPTAMDHAGAGTGPAHEPEAAEAPEAGAPRPLGIGTTATGHRGVDAVLARLADADHLAVGAHGEVYEDVHRGLRDTLTALDAPQPESVTPRS